ncbi:MAG: DNA repair protein RecO [Flavobacteriales bacterium]
MDQHTQGIVLNQLKYSESALIVKIYTLHFGIQSYIVKGVRKKCKKNYATLFQPLSYIDFTSFSYKRNDLKIFKEGRNLHFFKSLHSHPIKITLSFFLSDILLSTLKEETSNTALFHFINQSLQILDEEEHHYANFHLWFMLHLTKFLGFYPNTDSDSNYFNLMEGCFTYTNSMHTCSKEDSILIKKFLKLTINQSLDLKINKLKRQNILDILIKYYNLHNYTISNLRSLKIIQEVFEIL